MLSRRQFLSLSAGSVLVLAAPDGTTIAQAAIPGGTLDPSSIPKFVSELLRPTMFTPVTAGGVDRYLIAARPLRSQLLPAGMPATPIFGYAPAGMPDGLAAQRFWSMQAHQGRPVRTTWVNALTGPGGRPVPHLLPVDPSLHWANPGRLPDHMGMRTTDSRPALHGLRYAPPATYRPGKGQYTDYTGPVPTVTHLHGPAGVGDESDGYPEAWVLPSSASKTYAAHGKWWEFQSRQFAGHFGRGWLPGTQTTMYTNTDRPATLWFHDHTLGMTRLNVYAGLEGFYLVRGEEQSLRDKRSGRPARLPNGTEELPLMIADRAFQSNGRLFYPGTRTFFDDYKGEYLPHSDLSPVWNPEFFGNTLLVNGRTWPYVHVQRRRYRVRLCNACQARTLILGFDAIPGVRVHQIGNDAGLLPAVVDLGTRPRVRMAPGERVDLIVDFTNTPSGRHVLTNVGPDDPYGMDDDVEPSDPGTTGQVIQFRVGSAPNNDPSTPAGDLVLPQAKRQGRAHRVRRLALIELTAKKAPDSPIGGFLGIVTGDPNSRAGGQTVVKHWMDPVTEVVGLNRTEIWEVYNTTEDAHPIHLHRTGFEVINRQPLMEEKESTGAATKGMGGGMGSPEPPRVRVDHSKPAVGPLPGERGRKDTLVMPPGHVTRIKVTFDADGQFVWHCHILEHEDNEMMRPIRVGPRRKGQPD